VVARIRPRRAAGSWRCCAGKQELARSESRLLYSASPQTGEWIGDAKREYRVAQAHERQSGGKDGGSNVLEAEGAWRHTSEMIAFKRDSRSSLGGGPCRGWAGAVLCR
jgi:hypothetical protein